MTFQHVNNNNKWKVSKILQKRKKLDDDKKSTHLTRKGSFSTYDAEKSVLLCFQLSVFNQIYFAISFFAFKEAINV